MFYLFLYTVYIFITDYSYILEERGKLQTVMFVQVCHLL